MWYFHLVCFVDIISGTVNDKQLSCHVPSPNPHQIHLHGYHQSPWYRWWVFQKKKRPHKWFSFHPCVLSSSFTFEVRCFVNCCSVSLFFDLFVPLHPIHTFQWEDSFDQSDESASPSVSPHSSAKIDASFLLALPPVMRRRRREGVSMTSVVVVLCCSLSMSGPVTLYIKTTRVD